MDHSVSYQIENLFLSDGVLQRYLTMCLSAPAVLQQRLKEFSVVFQKFFQKQIDNYYVRVVLHKELEHDYASLQYSSYKRQVEVQKFQKFITKTQILGALRQSGPAATARARLLQNLKLFLFAQVFPQQAQHLIESDSCAMLFDRLIRQEAKYIEKKSLSRIQFYYHSVVSQDPEKVLFGAFWVRDDHFAASAPVTAVLTREGKYRLHGQLRISQPLLACHFALVRANVTRESAPLEKVPPCVLERTV